MSAVPVTGLYAAALAVLSIALAARVVILRRRFRVGVGTGDHPELARAVRVHANLVEYAPIALVLMLILELSEARSLLVHGLGLVLVVGRLLHAWGLSGKSGVSFGRFYGTALTWAMILTGAGALLWQAVSG